MAIYSHRYRPTGHATLPRGIEFALVSAPREIAHLRMDLPWSPRQYGTFITNRPLTDDELKSYEIEVME